MFAQVTVTSIVEFARENLHFVSRYDEPIIEKFFCITMETDDGRLLKNFTKFNSEFAVSVNEGDSFLLSYTKKDGHRVDPETVPYTAVTYCHKGLTKADLLAEKKAAKIAARNRKLGLA